MTTFLTYFMDSKRSKCGSGILEFHFFVFQNFDCKPRYAWFSIFLCLNVAFLFLHLSLCYFFLNNALGLLNPNLFKFLRYLYPILRYLKKSLFFSNSVFYSVRTLFKTMQLFSTSLAIKFDPDGIEKHSVFCSWKLRAMPYSSKIVEWLVRKCQSCTNYNLGRLKTTAWWRMG
jgi:hypothetical protein